MKGEECLEILTKGYHPNLILRYIDTQTEWVPCTQRNQNNRVASNSIILLTNLGEAEVDMNRELTREVQV